MSAPVFHLAACMFDRYIRVYVLHREFNPFPALTFTPPTPYLQRSVHSRIYRHFPSLTLPVPAPSFLSQIRNHLNFFSSPPTGGHGLLYRRRITGRIPPPSQSSHPCRCTLHLSWHTAMPHATDGNSLRIGCRHMRALWSARHAACWTV